MLLAVDVHYGDAEVVAACVGFAAWCDADTTLEHVHHDPAPPAAYEPGQFYKRELPHLVRVIDLVRARHAIELVVVDAHAWLDAGAPGLGARLHEALGGDVPVVGVAKTAYRGAPAIEVVRGESTSPLFVSAVAFEAEHAAELVRTMHGPFRVPTLLKRADHLARGHARPDPAKAY